MFTGHSLTPSGWNAYMFFYSKNCSTTYVPFGDAASDNQYPSHYANYNALGGIYMNGAFSQFVELTDGEYCIHFKAAADTPQGSTYILSLIHI